MTEKRTVFLLASATVLALALNQGAWAQAETGTAPPAPAGTASAPAAATGPGPAPAAAAAPAPAAARAPAPAQEAAPDTSPAPAAEPATTMETAPEAPITAAEAASARMEERHEAMMEKRRERYQELRERAAEVGLELPETPPWEASGLTPPEMPTPPAMPALPDRPSMRGGPSAEAREARREARYEAVRARAAEIGVELPETPPWKLASPEERQAHWEAMRNMTPEQRAAMREQHWAEMRERAAERGVELPETPPWKLMQEKREEMRAKWDAYRETVEQMTDEQREAAAAIFGREQAPGGQEAPPQMPVQPGYGPGPGAMPAMPRQMPQPPMMPGYGKGAPGSWPMGKQPMMQVPPSAPAGPGVGW